MTGFSGKKIVCENYIGTYLQNEGTDETSCL